MSTNYNDPIYDDLAKDDRIGSHDWYVTEIKHDTWPSGDPRTKIVGSILTASADNNGGKPKADLTISPLPSPDEVRAGKDSWTRGKKMAISAARNIYKQLAEFYHKSPDENPPNGFETIQEGDTFRVHIEKNREGFCRVVAFKSPTESTKETASAMADTPF